VRICEEYVRYIYRHLSRPIVPAQSASNARVPHPSRSYRDGWDRCRSHTPPNLSDDELHMQSIARPAPQRVLSVDVLRGLTIALMILVNDPGDPHCVYPQLQHAEWNGYTAADLVFPNFLFLSGASLVFSLQSRVERSRKQGRSLAPIAASLARRSLNLLALKLLVAAFPAFRLRRIRIFGVLFRTALLSLLGGLTLLATFSIPILLGVVSALLGGYWLALRLPFRLPNGEALNHPLLDPDNNLAAWLDRKIAHLFHGQLHTGALYNVTHDPEGLLSSAAALATVLIGSVAALVLRHKVLNPIHKRNLLAAAGLASLAAGHLSHQQEPLDQLLRPRLRRLVPPRARHPLHRLRPASLQAARRPRFRSLLPTPFCPFPVSPLPDLRSQCSPRLHPVHPGPQAGPHPPPPP
jgi:predicted acyltransferase